MENRILSSRLTFFVKFILAPIALVIQWALFLFSLDAGNPGAAIVPLLSGAFFTAFVLLEIKPLKSVEVCDGELQVSDYFKQISIPLEQVHTVYLSQDRGAFAAIHLRQETEFGKIIKFVPAGMQAIFNRHRWEDEARRALKPAPR